MAETEIEVKKLPRFSMDLIEELDKETPMPSLPLTVGEWDAFDEAKARRLAFMSGMRAMVDMLIHWAREQEDGDDSDTPVDGERWSTGRVVDSFGEYRRVVSMDMAGSFSPHELRADPDTED